MLSQLPQKRDILRQAVVHLKAQRFMPTRSVHAVTTGYQSVFNDVYPHLSLVERNCLHVIYERLRVAEEVMDGLEDDFLKAVKDKAFDDPWAAFAGRLEETLASYEVVEDLARAYIAMTPIDVFSAGGIK
jgi:phytoene/squalene synthetase